ncbi:MAG: hypothetical protein WC242_03475 [Candidatus Paceibacterota bacterium]|jgi:hypothetical protein
MFREVAKQTLGVIVGGVIGGLIAFLIGGSFWWIGVLSGGFIGYLAGEPKELLQGLRAARRCFVHLKPIDRPGYRFLLGILSSSWVLVCGIILSIHFSSTIYHFGVNIAIITIGILMGMAYILPALYMKNLEKDYLPLVCKDMVKLDWLSALIHFPIFLLFSICLIFQGTWNDFLFPCLKASWRFFRYIHSRKRAIRLIDSMIVAFIAWRFGGNIPEIATIGIVGGLVVAPIHYYLVSIKLLGLVPNGGTSH